MIGGGGQPAPFFMDIKTTFHDNPDNEAQALIHQSQDVEPYLEYAKAMRNDEEYTRQGIKNNFWHVGTLPMIVVARWAKEGFDITTADTKSLMAKIQSDPMAQGFLTTNKRIG